MSDLGRKVKCQPRPLDFLTDHYHTRFNILSENDEFGFNKFQKIKFQNLSHHS